MRRLCSILGLLVVATWLVGCGPTVTVQNNTGFAVRVVVTSNGVTSVLSPTPGESSTAEVEAGAFKVVVIPDAEWVDYAKVKRKVLNDLLANSQNLTGEQLLAVVAQLKDIAQKMASYQQAGGKGAGCAGSVSEDSSAQVEVGQAADGTLAVVCK